MRFRIDGTLREVVQPNRALHAALISRLKIMADLDIAEKRLPQDGRISLRIGTRAVDVRVSTLPTAHGERAVLRLLDKSESRLTLEAVGMQGDTLARFEQLIAQPHGIILVTGPTGSGKTTTLYAALSRLDAGRSNIMTVEDPIEYELPGVGQTQVNAKIELTFAKALRAILRQDPDVIMIGEIRDFETAQIAIQASLTGHLVLATLHTNDSVSAVTRLTDMGVEPFLLSSSLLGVLAQRLVRKLSAPVLRRAPAATPAASTGYQGRTGIFELLVADEAVQSLIHSRAPESQLFVAAEQRRPALDARGRRAAGGRAASPRAPSCCASPATDSALGLVLGVLRLDALARGLPIGIAPFAQRIEVAAGGQRIATVHHDALAGEPVALAGRQRKVARFCSSLMFPGRAIGLSSRLRWPGSSPGLRRLLMPSVGISPGPTAFSRMP